MRRGPILLLVAGLGLSVAGCASRTVEPGAAETGGALLEQRCSICHELTEVTKFAGYYGEAQWSAVISTMVNYGAQLSSAERPVLLHYLTDELAQDGG